MSITPVLGPRSFTFPPGLLPANNPPFSTLLARRPPLGADFHLQPFHPLFSAGRPTNGSAFWLQNNVWTSSNIECTLRSHSSPLFAPKSEVYEIHCFRRLSYKWCTFISSWSKAFAQVSVWRWFATICFALAHLPPRLRLRIVLVWRHRSMDGCRYQL